MALHDDPIIERIHAAHEARMAALEPARAARKAAGLDPYRQRFDPRTGKVVNG